MLTPDMIKELIPEGGLRLEFINELKQKTCTQGGEVFLFYFSIWECVIVTLIPFENESCKAFYMSHTCL